MLSRLRIILFFLIFFALTIIPLPQEVNFIRPLWILVFTLYLLFFGGRHVTVLLVLFLGLLLDVLLATVLGEHVFALSFTVLAAYSKSRRFVLYSLTQQIFAIGFFCLVYQLVVALAEASQGYMFDFVSIVGPVFSTALLWPWLKVLFKIQLSLEKSNKNSSFDY